MIERLDSDIEGHGWHPDDGAPSVALFASAVQVWAVAQEDAGDATIDAAALAFNVEPELIREAVDWHPWMYLDGLVISHEGE